MSFGWSAGDIAAAASLVNRLIQALDSCDGAACDYREDLSFLRDLNCTLEPLQGFTAWNAYPAYGQDIGEQVGHIKVPVDQFLAAVLKYEPSLGSNAPEGRHRHCVRKLQWYIFMSTKVLNLKKTIKSHMRIIDTVLQRSMLYVTRFRSLALKLTSVSRDVVWTTQQQLPDNLRASFQETIRPELINILQEHLPSQNPTLLEIRQEIQNARDVVSMSKLLALHEELSSNINVIKQQVNSSKITQKCKGSCLRGDSPKHRHHQQLPSIVDAQSVLTNPGNSDQKTTQTASSAAHDRTRESLKEV